MSKHVILIELKQDDIIMKTTTKSVKLVEKSFNKSNQTY